MGLCVAAGSCEVKHIQPLHCSPCVSADVSIGFVVDSLEVTEDVGTFQVCVDASTTEYEGDIEVTLSYEDGTAQGTGGSTIVSQARCFSQKRGKISGNYCVFHSPYVRPEGENAIS